MFRPFRLKRPIGPDSVMDRDDVLSTKRALNGLGYFEAPDYGLTPYPDAPMIDAVKGFQRRHKLRVDGVMKPDGPTVRKINDLVSARRADLFDRISNSTATWPMGSTAPLPGEKPRAPRAISTTSKTIGLARSGKHPRPKNPSEVIKTVAAGAAVPAIPGVIPGIVGAIAGMLGLTLPLRGDTPKDDERKRRCDEQYEQDSEICRKVKVRRGPRAAQGCWESAALRYGNCLAGRPMPELDKGTD